MPESVGSMATRFEDLSAARLATAARGKATDSVAEAQAAATLALALRVRDLTDKLDDRLFEIRAALRD